MALCVFIWDETDEGPVGIEALVNKITIVINTIIHAPHRFEISILKTYQILKNKHCQRKESIWQFGNKNL